MWYDLPDLKYVRKDMDLNDDIPYFDFGHGGNDTGCIFYDKTYEKNYNLKFGMAVYEICKPYFKKIYLTRTTDRTVAPNTRINSMTNASSKHKRIHVYSLHVNAYNGMTSGAEVCLSKTARKTGDDYIHFKSFLQHYCKEFGLKNRGIVQRKLSNGEDYYYLMRETPNNCKSKIIELFFGDNRDDCRKGQTSAYFDKATFFVASYILKRYGITIPKPKPEPSVLYVVQTGAFGEFQNAVNQQKLLKTKGFDSIIKTIKK